MKKRTLLYLFFAILVMFNIGCDKEEDIIDILPPSEVSNLKATPGEQIINLEWTNPEDDDFDHVEIISLVNSQNVIIPNGIISYEITGLENGVEYNFTLKTVDINTNISTGISIKSTPIDLTAPQEVTNFIAIGGENKVTLNWTDPSDLDFEKVEISYTPGSTDFIYVYKGTEEYIIEGLTIGTEYTFTVKAIDDNENQSTGITASATPVYEIAGEYECNEGLYYRLGILNLTTEHWPDVTTIIAVDENIYNVIDYFGPFENNSWYFQIDEYNNITYPLTLDGITQTANGEPLITCESNPGDMTNVNCDNSNFVTFDGVNGNHQLTMTIGYYTPGSGPREFYQILEKIN